MEEAVQVLVENSKRFGISELPLQNGSLKKSPQNNIIDPPMLPLCEICGDKSTGRHYKVFSCEGCKNFFRRSVRREREYKCPAYGRCAVDKSQRTRCRACRMAKCLRIGMRKEAVQCERKPLALTQEGFPFTQEGFLVSLDNNGDIKVRNGGEDSDGLESKPEQEGHFPPESSTDSPTQEIPNKQENQNSGTESNPSTPNDNALVRPQANQPSSEQLEYSRAYLTDTSLYGVYPFVLDPPSMPLTDPGYLYELSTRLLFASVDWVKGLMCFSRLCDDDKVHLMVEKWYLLFALGLLQCSNMFPVSTLLTLAGRVGDTPALKWQTFTKLKCVIMSGGLIGRVAKEVHEYMKIVTLFDQGVPGLVDVDVIYETRKRAQIALETTLAESAYSSDQDVGLREKIVYALESINKINKQEIREAFFELLLKETSVESIVKRLLLEQA